MNGKYTTPGERIALAVPEQRREVDISLRIVVDVAAVLTVVEPRLDDDLDGRLLLAAPRVLLEPPPVAA